MIHFLIVSLGSADLLALALESIRKYAPASMVDVVPLPLDTTDPATHGRAIDQWRETYQGQVLDNDVVVIMDPDVVILSHQWRVELVKAFTDPEVGMWGAGAVEDFGPRVHASMMAIGGNVWNEVKRSFVPCRDPREQKWRDTGGLYCLWVNAEWSLRPLERGPDWYGVSAWWGMGERLSPVDTLTYYQMVPLWAHLGGGSHSDYTRLNLWQRLRRWKQIYRRQRFIAAATAHFSA